MDMQTIAKPEKAILPYFPCPVETEKKKPSLGFQQERAELLPSTTCGLKAGLTPFILQLSLPLFVLVNSFFFSIDLSVYHNCFCLFC